MECNIGAAGKAARLKLGIAAVLGGFLAGIILSGLLQGTIWWLGVAGAIFGGAFAIWESRVGWCVVRAGIQNPIVIISLPFNRTRRLVGNIVNNSVYRTFDRVGNSCTDLARHHEESLSTRRHTIHDCTARTQRFLRMHERHRVHRLSARE